LGVEHGLTVEDHDNIAGRGNIAFIAGEPDRIDLAGAGGLSNDATVLGGAQARVLAGKAVIVATGSVEAGKLLGMGAGGQLWKSVELAINIPPGGSITGHSYSPACANRSALDC